MATRTTSALDCLCLGIAVADHICVPIARMPNAGELVVCDRLDTAVGGCAANVALDLAKLGTKVALAARIGPDLFGRFLSERLNSAGVRTELLVETADRETSGTLVINVRGEDRRFIHSFGANAEFDGSEITDEAIRSARVLYVGGYFAMPKLRAEAVAKLFRQAREAGTRTVLDVVLPRPGDYWPELDIVLPWTDVFLPNQDEARLLTGCEDPVDQARRLRTLGAETVVITCGGEGAVVIGPDDSFRVGAFPVDYVDGTGSGDAFDAGYIYGLLQDANPRDCALYGSALGGSCVRQSGATAGVFTREELVAYLGGAQANFSAI
jgi:sugar/nucleoside kinase (ribokinase family)